MLSYNVFSFFSVSLRLFEYLLFSIGYKWKDLSVLSLSKFECYILVAAYMALPEDN